MIRKLTLCGLVALALALGACAKRGAEPASDTTASSSTADSSSADASASQSSGPGETVMLVSPIPIAGSAEVRDAVRDECRLSEKLERFITQFSAERNIDIQPTDAASAAGRVLTVRITDVYAPGGGAFSGGKAVTVSGELSEGGNEIGSFRARRISGGGAFAVFKGTCDILGRDVETLGSDISGFLADPQPNARMGNI